jgi:hypothetical protein
MIIQRSFAPDPDTLERVVEILYRMLMETPHGIPESSQPDTVVGRDATCLSTGPE